MKTDKYVGLDVHSDKIEIAVPSTARPHGRTHARAEILRARRTNETSVSNPRRSKISTLTV